MNITSILICLATTLPLAGTTNINSPDYRKYHAKINEAEWLISDGYFKEALELYEVVFVEYDFVFLRDYKIAAQLALHLNKKKKIFPLH